jgi:hypothetical protein
MQIEWGAVERGPKGRRSRWKWGRWKGGRWKWDRWNGMHMKGEAHCRGMGGDGREADGRGST